MTILTILEKFLLAGLCIDFVNRNKINLLWMWFYMNSYVEIHFRNLITLLKQKTVHCNKKPGVKYTIHSDLTFLKNGDVFASSNINWHNRPIDDAGGTIAKPIDDDIAFIEVVFTIDEPTETTIFTDERRYAILFNSIQEKQENLECLIQKNIENHHIIRRTPYVMIELAVDKEQPHLITNNLCDRYVSYFVYGNETKLNLEFFKLCVKHSIKLDITNANEICLYTINDNMDQEKHVLKSTKENCNNVWNWNYGKHK